MKTRATALAFLALVTAGRATAQEDGRSYPPPVAVHAEEDGPWRLVRHAALPDQPDVGTDLWLMESDLARGDTSGVIVLMPMNIDRAGVAFSWHRIGYQIDCEGGRYTLFRMTTYYSNGRRSGPFEGEGWETPSLWDDESTMLDTVCALRAGRGSLDDLPRAETSAEALAKSGEMERPRWERYDAAQAGSHP